MVVTCISRAARWRTNGTPPFFVHCHCLCKWDSEHRGFSNHTLPPPLLTHEWFTHNSFMPNRGRVHRFAQQPAWPNPLLSHAHEHHPLSLPPPLHEDLGGQSGQLGLHCPTLHASLPSPSTSHKPPVQDRWHIPTPLPRISPPRCERWPKGEGAWSGVAKGSGE